MQCSIYYTHVGFAGQCVDSLCSLQVCGWLVEAEWDGRDVDFSGAQVHAL